MAFDQPIRNRLQKFVSEARDLLTKEFRRQLQAEYGMDPTTGGVSSLDVLTYLDDNRRETAHLLRETLEHYLAGDPSNNVMECLDRIVREQAFTVLNRLCALRMAEARGILIESIGNGYQSRGFQLYARLSGPALGETGDAYRCYLFSIFDEFALDLAVLFDRFSPQDRLFPRESALLELLSMINHPDIAPLWAEDETIGWIYQYFNSSEERRRMRADSHAPRTSRELAVRNQFFTPRYVVEFLTDNTLGRTWYEMTRGKTVLKEQCRYLVHRPNEIFLAEGEEVPQQDESAENLSQEELLKQPVYIPFRMLKDPREILMLDPACGSMHFGLYAFDLFEKIYEEAWELEGQTNTEVFVRNGELRSLRETYESKEVLMRDVPRLIIEHNIHGIDIDPRAVQIAGLSLWLRAQRSWQAQAIKPQDRPQILKSNVVCAEPMPGEKEMLQEFTENLKPHVLGQLAEIIFDKMQLAGEAGSLLKIEEEIEAAIAAAREDFREELLHRRGAEATLFPELAQRRQLSMFDFTDMPGETQFWNDAEQKILYALQEYAEQSETTCANRKRLFASDTSRGFAFIDICRKRYDVILMNPPFGNGSEDTVDYLSRCYRNWNANLLCAFVARAWGLLQEGGAVGCIYDRTANVKSTYENFRRELLVCDDRLVAMVDLGWGVLDANVETAAQILAQKWMKPAYFFDVRPETPENKEIVLQQYLHSIRTPIIERGSALRSFPNASLAYDMPKGIRRAFSRFPALKNAGAYAIVGHQLKSDWHMRCWWEIPPHDLGKDGKYRRMYNGGTFCCYYMPLVEIALWGDSGKLVRDHKSVYLRNSAYQFFPAVGYGKRGDFVDAHVIPEGFIFTNEGQAVLVDHDDARLFFLGLLNSRFFTTTINLYCGQHKQSGYVNLFPVANVRGKAEQLEIGDEARRIALEKREVDSRNEASPIFLGLPQTERGSAKKVIRESRQTSEQIEKLIFQLYDFSEEERKEVGAFAIQWPDDSVPFFGAEPILDVQESDVSSSLLSYLLGVLVGRWDIRLAQDKSLVPRLPDLFAPLPVCPPGMLIDLYGLPTKSGSIVSEEWLHARLDANALPSKDAAKKPTIQDSEYPIRISWRGILVDDAGHPQDIVGRARETLEIILADKAEDIEQEVCEILCVSSLRDYFGKPGNFFADHLKRYSKSRRQAPIYWPLSTASGSYTLWLYYLRLTDQTLYICVNDFVEPKLKIVSESASRLRQKPHRSSEEEKELERLGDLELELKDFLDELLRIAAFWKPSLNDGVQITAAPLWKLFKYAPWQRTLKDTWAKLERGDYDWAQLACSIWPKRVREKCKKDKSLAIAHDLEELYEEQVAEPKKKGGGRRVKAQ